MSYSGEEIKQVWAEWQKSWGDSGEWIDRDPLLQLVEDIRLLYPRGIGHKRQWEHQQIWFICLAYWFNLSFCIWFHVYSLLLFSSSYTIFLVCYDMGHWAQFIIFTFCFSCIFHSDILKLIDTTRIKNTKLHIIQPKV